jgi:hypothetical protein
MGSRQAPAPGFGDRFLDLIRREQHGPVRPAAEPRDVFGDEPFDHLRRHVGRE